jgi:hypothetical protein
MASPVQKLRAMLGEKDNIVVCPGVFDGLTARIALNAGFECLYMVSGQNIKYTILFLTHISKTKDRSWNDNVEARNARSWSSYFK